MWLPDRRALKRQPKTQLNCPGTRRRGDGSEVGCCEIPVRRVELRRVGCVEKLGAELQVRAFSDRLVAAERQIDRFDAWCPQPRLCARIIADRVCRCGSE